MRKFTVSLVFCLICFASASNITAQTVATLSTLNPVSDEHIEAISDPESAAGAEHADSSHSQHDLPQANLPPVTYPPQAKLLPSHQRYFALHAVSTQTWRLPRALPFSEATQ